MKLKTGVSESIIKRKDYYVKQQAQSICNVRVRSTAAFHARYTIVSPDNVTLEQHNIASGRNHGPYAVPCGSVISAVMLAGMFGNGGIGRPVRLTDPNGNITISGSLTGGRQLQYHGDPVHVRR